MRPDRNPDRKKRRPVPEIMTDAHLHDAIKTAVVAAAVVSLALLGLLVLL